MPTSSNSTIAEALIGAIIPAVGLIFATFVTAWCQSRSAAHTAATEDRRQTWDEINDLLKQAQVREKQERDFRLDCETEAERQHKADLMVVSKLRSALARLLKEREAVDSRVILTEEHQRYLDLLRSAE